MVEVKEAWVPFHVADRGGSRFLVRLKKTEGRWVSTGFVVTADQVDSQIMKLAASSVSFIVDMVNANQDYYLVGSLSQTGPALNEAIAEALADPAAGPLPEPKDRDPLTRPDGSDPDGYYRRVAEAYADAVARRRSPAEALAQEAAVPIATARGWIREARRRGILAPGRRKAAG